MDIIQSFYDDLAADYDKLFQDWQATTVEPAGADNAAAGKRLQGNVEIPGGDRLLSADPGRKKIINRAALWLHNASIVCYTETNISSNHKSCQGSSCL